MPERDDRLRLYLEIAGEVEPLRALLPASEVGALRLFDEFLRENELGPAMHVVCDFLLELHSPAPSRELVRKIEFLHRKMEIADDCVVRLRPKITL